MNARQLLIETYVHMPPVSVVEEIKPGDAERTIPGAGHSIAEIVAHMAFWQDWFVTRCQGAEAPMPAQAALGWPAVPAGSWLEVQRRFVSGLEAAAALDASGDRTIAPAIEFPPLAGYTVRDALVHMAQHNSHHLGQVILLRQIIGRWPPPSGAWTW